MTITFTSESKNAFGKVVETITLTIEYTCKGEVLDAFTRFLRAAGFFVNDLEEKEEKGVEDVTEDPSTSW